MAQTDFVSRASASVREGLPTTRLFSLLALWRCALVSGSSGEVRIRMTATTDETLLRAACREHPGESTPQLELADELQANGREEDAILLRCRAVPTEDAFREQYAAYLERLPEVRVTCENCGGYGQTPKEKGKGGYTSQGALYRCMVCASTGTIADTGQRDRAEFIRAAIELARHADEDIHHDADLERLWVSQQRLAAKYPEWRPVCPVCAGKGRVDPPCDTCDGCGRVPDPDSEYSDGTMDCPDCSSSWCDFCKGTGRVGVWDRGLVVEVPCRSLADVMEREEDGNPRILPHEHVWIPTDWALSLPPTVTRVVVGDRVPYSLDNSWWYSALPEENFPAPQNQNALPKFIWDELRGYTMASKHWKYYPAAELAVLSLSTAVADWLREHTEASS